MKNKGLLAFCMSVLTILIFPNVAHAETINGYTRVDYLNSFYGLPPADWTEEGIFNDENGGSYRIGKYNAEVDRRTVVGIDGGSYAGQVGYADANMNMVISFTDKWDGVEDFYNGRAMASHNERGRDATGNYYNHDFKYLIDINGNVLNEIRLKYNRWDFDDVRSGSFITSDGEKYYYQISGFKNPKESAGFDVEVIKYSDGSYYNHFYSFSDYPFLTDRYEDGEHGNKLMLAEFDGNGVAELKCYDTDSWEYHTPIGLGDSGWDYTRTITLGKITIWGTVMQ